MFSNWINDYQSFDFDKLDLGDLYLIRHSKQEIVVAGEGKGTHSIRFRKALIWAIDRAVDVNNNLAQAYFKNEIKE